MSARRTIERALQYAAGNVSMRYHQAMIDAAIGDTASAIATLEAILAEGSHTFPERAEAASLLMRLKG